MRAGLPALALAACAPPTPDRYLVVDGRAGDYALVDAPIPELTNPTRMRGSLGDGTNGGYLDGELVDGDIADVRYAGGGALALEYVVQDGVAVPIHADGLELFSYYRALSALRTDLDELGIPTDTVFPVPFAYQPSVAGALLSSNAAYVSGGVHLFVLLPGGNGLDVPLAANPGVIRHEFGHALFSSIVGGGVRADAPWILEPEVSALNEGFADMVATLSLDDPDFIGLSVDLGGARDVRGDRTIEDAADPAEDPYSRGTVYASLAWDVREVTDPGSTLRCAVDALERWAATSPWDDGLEGIDTWAERFVEEVAGDDPSVADEVCAAHGRRFPGRPVPEPCR